MSITKSSMAGYNTSSTWRFNLWISSIKRISPSSKDDNIVKKVRDEGYGVTAIEVNESTNEKYMLYIQIKNRSFEHLKDIIKQLDKNAFIVVNETKYVENGYFNVEK